MTQRGALSIGVTVWGKEVIPQEDWKDDAGEFLHVGGAAIVKSCRGFLASSAIGRDRGQVDGKGKGGVFGEGVWWDRLRRESRVRWGQRYSRED